MCPVATILGVTSTIAGVAGASMSYVQGQNAAKAQSQMYYQNAKAANENAVRMYADTSSRQVQEMQSATVEQAESIKAARQAAATTRVAAGEAGISGLSVDALLGDIYGADAKYRDNIDQQTEWTVAQLQREKEGIQSSAQDRVNSVTKGTSPNFLELGLKIGQAGLDGYSTYSKYKKP